MTFEQGIANISPLLSAMAILFTFLSSRATLKYYEKKDIVTNTKRESDLCAEFFAYVKKASHFGLSQTELIEFFRMYTKLQTIKSKELKKVLVKCANSMMEGNKIPTDLIGECMEIYTSVYGNKPIF